MENIHVAFCCDDAFIVPAKVMLESLLRSNRGVCIIAHTFSDDLNEMNIRELGAMLEEYGGRLVTYQIPAIAFETINNAPTLEHISVATYYRLLLPYVLGEDVKKILYLDCDILVRKEIKGYYDVALEGYVIAGVSDIYDDICKERLNLPEYVNAGILVMNIEKMRTQLSLLQMLEAMNRLMETVDLPFGDQDIINIFFPGQIRLLPKEFNYQYVVKKKYVLKHMKEAKKAVIVHFITADKPWKDTYVFPYLREYYKYLRKYLSVRKKIRYWLLKPKGVIEGLKTYEKYKKINRRNLNNKE